MKKICIIIAGAIILCACHASRTLSPKPVADKNDIQKLEGNWQLEMLFSSDNNWSTPPFININLGNNTISGNSGCNSISGKLTINGNYFGVDKNLVSTKMACADAKSNRDEKTFLSALLKINRFTLLKDELELGQGEITLLKFKKH